MTKFTVAGSTGFIGGALVRHLRAKGYEVQTPQRGESLNGKKCGHVIYAIGMTGNFRERLQETVDAHVNVLQRLMEGAEYDSWLYLSSARVYQHSPSSAEDADICIKPGADAVYDLSKLLGESICLAQPRTKIARLSNVYGAGQSGHTFLGSILRDLKKDGKAVFRESPGSSKDYVAIEDVVNLLELISTRGKEQIYNVASGQAVTHGALAEAIGKCGYSADFAPSAPTRSLPPVDIARIHKEFGIKPRSILEDLPRLLQDRGHE
ncbi:MAG: SDR family oxidoreductase [Alphaproteobacteria bacterium]|nr:SDR family oxidoreductase [Alphaproteobacteria bacterium]